MFQLITQQSSRRRRSGAHHGSPVSSPGPSTGDREVRAALGSTRHPVSLVLGVYGRAVLVAVLVGFTLSPGSEGPGGAGHPEPGALAVQVGAAQPPGVLLVPPVSWAQVGWWGTYRS